MKPRQSVRRRGQPLLALALLMVSWVGARAAMWEPAVVRQGAKLHDPAAPDKAAKAKVVVPASGVRPDLEGPSAMRPKPAAAAPRSAPQGPELAPPAPEPTPPPLAPPQGANGGAASGPDQHGRATATPDIFALEAGHAQLLAEGMQMPMIEQGAAMDAPQRRLPGANALIQREGSRWAADAWLLLRDGGNGYNAPGAGLPGVVVPVGFYGGSQAGLVLRYRLAPGSPLRPTLYLRGSSGVQFPRGEELAAGFAIRPLAGVPFSLMAEGRATHTVSGTRLRPAVAVVSELPPARLPLGMRGEAYVQAGYVGGRDATAFVDGQARIERPFVRSGKFELRAGGGAWGGAQSGASRLDVGPTATLAVPVGPGGARVSADYRIRVAGRAAPGSGAVITLSAGF